MVGYFFVQEFAVDEIKQEKSICFLRKAEQEFES